MNAKGKTGCGPRWGWARHREAGGWSPPWARGFGFGGPGGGPRSPRLFGQGDLRLLLLALIADKPSHGYDLIRTIEARFNGSYAPSAGTVYPNLTLLEEQDLIAVTPHGVALISEHLEAINGLGTAIMVAGAKAGRERLLALPAVDALIVDADNELWLSPGMTKRLQATTG